MPQAISEQSAFQTQLTLLVGCLVLSKTAVFVVRWYTMNSLKTIGVVQWHFWAGFVLVIASFVLGSSNYLACTVAFLFGVSFVYLGYLSSKQIAIEGKAVLITGCDTGFGHDLAVRLHQIGFQVFACCLNDESEGATRLKQANTDGAMHVLKVNVTIDEDIERAKQYVLDNLNNTILWGVVNNAGIAFSHGFVEFQPMEVFEKVSAVNLFGVIRVTKSLLPMIRKNRGRIVNVSSLLARISMPLCADYTIAKQGVEAFSNCLRREMRQFGVKVCTVQPGNFMGATNILRDSRKENSLLYVWSQLDEDAQGDYDIEEIERQQRFVDIIKTQSHSTTAPCIDAMVDALCRVHPKTHYFVASLQDKLAVYFTEYLPVWMADVLCEVMIKAQLAIDSSA